MEKVKKKKPKSLSRKLRDLREAYGILHRANDKYWEKIRNLRDKVAFLESLTPLHLYKIEFKIKANNENVYTFTEIKEGYTFKNAIDNLKSDKTYPDTFELVNLTVLV